MHGSRGRRRRLAKQRRKDRTLVLHTHFVAVPGTSCYAGTVPAGVSVEDMSGVWQRMGAALPAQLKRDAERLRKPKLSPRERYLKRQGRKA